MVAEISAYVPQYKQKNPALFERQEEAYKSIKTLILWGLHDVAYGLLNVSNVTTRIKMVTWRPHNAYKKKSNMGILRPGLTVFLATSIEELFKIPPELPSVIVISIHRI